MQPRRGVGTIGGGKASPTGRIDIAVMQSLSRQGEVAPLVENYGHIIIDECHHVGALSFDAILKRTQARFLLVLTERAEHLEAIRNALHGLSGSPSVVHGRMSHNQRAAVVAALDDLPEDAPRILLATGKLVGEGFYHPPARYPGTGDAGFLGGTLQQYAGRLHREHAGKTKVRLMDFVDTGHPALLRMWEKRQRGYRAMGYRIASNVC